MALDTRFPAGMTSYLDIYNDEGQSRVNRIWKGSSYGGVCCSPFMLRQAQHERTTTHTN